MSFSKQFNYIYTMYYEKAYRFAQIYVRNDLVAEDIVTESLIKMWETMKKETVENPPALLIKIIKNKSLDYLRKRLREEEAFKNLKEWQERELSIRISTLEACDPDIILSNEIRAIISNTLQTIHPKTRKIFILSRFEQKSGKEIAEILGISVKGVDYHIAKALKALRVSLKDYLPSIISLLMSLS